jgi:hypothetical protein
MLDRTYEARRRNQLCYGSDGKSVFKYALMFGYPAGIYLSRIRSFFASRFCMFWLVLQAL